MWASLILLTTLAWTDARPDYAWSFPKDHWAHQGYKTEWWYFTGHLDTEGVARFAYQFTLFNVGLSESPTVESAWSTRTLIMGHAAITDLATGEHRFSEVVQRVTPFLGDFGSYPERIAWCRAPTGSAGTWTLDRDEQGFVFSMTDMTQRYGFALHTKPAKALIFEGPNGLSAKGDGASLYYSETRELTAGTVDFDGKRYVVRGESWMDKEFGSSMLGAAQIGWDWFSLQLDGERELMLYVLRHSDGTTDFASGTLVAADGTTTYLKRGDFSVTSDRSWESAATKARYPAHWRIIVAAAGIDLELTPLAADQENVSTLVSGLFYWEGAVRISGSATGRGFVELTGYGTTLGPALQRRVDSR